MVLKFKILGFPVQVLPGYWLLTAFLAWAFGFRAPIPVVVLVVVLFVSLLVHELGHAFAARSFGLPAQITFNMVGGATSFPPGTNIDRAKDIVISAAGPGAGLALALPAYVLYQMFAPADVASAEVADVGLFLVAIEALFAINVMWSLFNLIPVVPFDGGRILVAALGPKYKQVAASVSLVVGLGAALLLFQSRWILAGALVGMAALSSFFRARAEAGPQAPDEANELSLEGTLDAADGALKSETFDQAALLAESAITEASSPKQRKRALEILLWARLGAGDAAGAAKLVTSTSSDLLDPYVVAAVHEASGDSDQAIVRLEAARAMGDSRVQVAALLVKLLLEQQRFADAATLACEVVAKIQPDDARRVADEVRRSGAHAQAGRLSMELAKFEKSFNDASAAVFSFAVAGAESELKEALKLATEFDPEAGALLLQDERLSDFLPRLEML